MKNLTLVALLALAPLTAWAVPPVPEQPNSILQGTEIELRTTKDSFQGTIRGRSVTGSYSDEDFSSRLTIGLDGQVIEAEFKKLHSVLGGLIRHESPCERIESRWELMRVDREKQTLTYDFNGAPVVVSIAAQAFENEHLIHPVFTTRYEGREISFKYYGHATYGYSAHLAMMILGAYLHGNTF